MIKKVINYTDYDGNEREESFYFNLCDTIRDANRGQVTAVLESGLTNKCYTVRDGHGS